MAVFTRVKTWVSNEVLTASDLNSEFNNLLNNTIPASIEDYSADVATMQSTTDPGGVGTESLATTLAGELQRIRFAIKRIVGGAQWYTAPVIDLGSTISAADIASDAVTTAKILDANVTRAKLEALGQQVSSPIGSFSTSSGSPVDATNLSVTITTTGRPVVVMLLSDTSLGVPSYVFATKDTSSQTLALGYVMFLRGSTVISSQELRMDFPASTTQYRIESPLSAFSHIDVVAAGTYTYKVQLNSVVATIYTIGVSNAKLIAYEL